MENVAGNKQWRIAVSQMNKSDLNPLRKLFLQLNHSTINLQIQDTNIHRIKK